MYDHILAPRATNEWNVTYEYEEISDGIKLSLEEQAYIELISELIQSLILDKHAKFNEILTMIKYPSVNYKNF